MTTSKYKLASIDVSKKWEWKFTNLFGAIKNDIVKNTVVHVFYLSEVWGWHKKLSVITNLTNTTQYIGIYANLYFCSANRSDIIQKRALQTWFEMLQNKLCIYCHRKIFYITKIADFNELLQNDYEML